MADGKRRVLVVDDEPSILKLVATRLQRAGFEVVVAMDGQAALMRVMEEPPPDVIILDVMLPKMNGYEVCSTLRQNQRFKNTPIIMFTALREEQDYWKAMSCGADAYLTKPYKAEDLEQLINRLINALHRETPGAGTQPATPPPDGAGGPA